MKANIIAVDFDEYKERKEAAKARMEAADGSKQIYPVHEKRHRIVR